MTWVSDDPWASFNGIQASSSILWIMKFYSFDLHFDAMIFVLKLDLDIEKM